MFIKVIQFKQGFKVYRAYTLSGTDQRKARDWGVKKGLASASTRAAGAGDGFNSERLHKVGRAKRTDGCVVSIQEPVHEPELKPSGTNHDAKIARDEEEKNKNE